MICVSIFPQTEFRDSLYKQLTEGKKMNRAERMPRLLPANTPVESMHFMSFCDLCRYIEREHTSFARRLYENPKKVFFTTESCDIHIKAYTVTQGPKEGLRFFKYMRDKKCLASKDAVLWLQEKSRNFESQLVEIEEILSHYS